MRKKAMLALVFASGILNLPTAALSKQNLELIDELIQTIAPSGDGNPEEKGYRLLKAARAYLNGDDENSIRREFLPGYNNAGMVPPFFSFRRNQTIFVDLADQVSLESQSSDRAKRNIESAARGKIDREQKTADRLLEMALVELERLSPGVEKLELYFIASKLSQQTGNLKATAKCDKVLQDAIHSSEAGIADEIQIRGVVSMLDSMAYAFIPVRVGEVDTGVNFLNQLAMVIPGKEAAFKVSERLKLKAVAIADRLSETADTRRRVHRDLALWYKQLGKKELADKQIDILYKLVGCRNESILFPQRGGCGQSIWWSTEKVESNYKCGMG